MPLMRIIAVALAITVAGCGTSAVDKADKKIDDALRRATAACVRHQKLLGMPESRARRFCEHR